MAGRLHHVCVNSVNFEETVRFFQEVFQMEISHTRGTAPSRKLWFQEGIQVNEAAHADSAGNLYDHIGIHVDNKEETLAKARAFGCTILPDKPKWFYTPDGTLIELME